MCQRLARMTWTNWHFSYNK